jgi:coenzyme F420-reducing hydrogenase alpha subunit
MLLTNLEPIRWLEEPARVAVRQDNSHIRAYLQVTTPRDLTAMCLGRPAEELPRILSIISPAHHLAAALVLDRLCEVTPPDLARHLREALLQSYFFRHHVRKLYFLLSAFGKPFAPERGPRSRAAQQPVPHQILEEAMHALGLIQEAATILGGRCDHPLTAVAGGVSRFLKEGHYERLAEIASACLEYAQRLGEFLRNEILGEDKVLGKISQLHIIPPIASLRYDQAAEAVMVVDGSGQERERFAPGETWQKLALQRESWTYQPFAYLKEKGWQNLDSSHSDGWYFVGPLARLNANQPLDKPLAEAERQRLLEALGPAPHFSVVAAFWAVLTELLEAAEKLQDLCSEKQLTGPEIRNVPDHIGEMGFAGLEAPEGFIYQQVEVDREGRVTGLEVLDMATENNVLRCLVTQALVAEAMRQNLNWDETKSKIELGLLPF